MLCLSGCAESAPHGLSGGADDFRDSDVPFGETTEDADAAASGGSGSGAEPGADEEPEPWGMPPEGGDAGWAEMVVPDEVACGPWVWQDIERSAYALAATEQLASTNALNAAKAAYAARAEKFAEAVPCTPGCPNRITRSRVATQSDVWPKDEDGGCYATKVTSPVHPFGPEIWCGKEYKGTEFVMCSEHTKVKSHPPEETTPSPEETWEYDETDDPTPTPEGTVVCQAAEPLSVVGFGLQFSQAQSISEATHNANKLLSDTAYEWVDTQCQQECTHRYTWLTDIDLASPDEAECPVTAKHTETLTHYLCDNDAQATQHVMCTE